MEGTRKTAGLRAGIAIGAAIALLGIAVGVTVASIPASGGTVSACYSTSTGALRVIDYPNHHCASGERMLRWNQTSAAGAVPLAALAGTACSSIGGAGTLYLGVTPGTGVVTFTCKLLFKVQSSIPLATIDLTLGPLGGPVAQRCVNATSCEVPFAPGSVVSVDITSATDFSLTCPGSGFAVSGITVDPVHGLWERPCPGITLNASTTVAVTKF